MVRNYYLLSRTRFYARKAFTMIELIFAIVVLAVVMLTIPMMIQTNNKALEGNVAQEAIFLVSALLSEATTFVWDNASLDYNVTNNNDYAMSKILDTSATPIVYNPGVPSTYYGRKDANSTIRIGGLEEDMHRRFFDKDIAGLGVVPVGNIIDPDLDNPTADMSVETGYKSDFNVTGDRYYVNDTAPTVSGGIATFDFSTIDVTGLGTTNIKLLEVVILAPKDTGGTPIPVAKLRAYTTNIGEVDYAMRRFD